MKFNYAGDRRRRDERRTAYNHPRREDGRRPRRDRSAGWREEYAAQDVPIPRTDGGSPVEDDRDPEQGRYVLPNPGAFVRDRDSEDGDELVVVENEEVPAHDYTIEATGRTVAEHNPEYPGWVPVVRAVYTEDLDALTRHKSPEELRRAVDGGDLRAYTFPAPRLGPLPDESSDNGGESEW